MAVFSTLSDYRSVGLRRLGGSSTPTCPDWNPPPRVVAALPRRRSLHARQLPGPRGERSLPAPPAEPLRVWHWSRRRRPHWLSSPRWLEPVRLVTMAERARSVAPAGQVAPEEQCSPVRSERRQEQSRSPPRQTRR